MTNVEVYGIVKHKINDENLYIEVERSYKNQKGIIEKDLLPCIYWSKDKKNLFMSLFDNTKIIIKGRLEVINENMVIVVEEFRPL